MYMTLPVVYYLVLIIFSCILLVKSVEWLISSSSSLAKAFKISEYTISVFMIAAATSFPELIFGITSAVNNKSILSFGNVIGSNIADLTIIIALPIIFGGALSTRNCILNKDLSYAGLFGILPILSVIDGVISRIDGILLILGYIIYLMYIVKREKENNELVTSLIDRNWKSDLFIFFSAACLILLSAQVLVKSAISFSEVSGLAPLLIGLTITAVGTSIPELVFGLKVIKTRQRGEILGSVLGSVAVNSTLVIGATALINPISKEGYQGDSSVAFLILTLIVFFILTITGRRITRKEALFLVLIYLCFVMVEKYLAKI